MAYILPQDLYVDGVSEDEFDELTVEDAILLATQYIERVCGQFFEPREDVRLYDGSGTKRLVFDVPLLRLDSVEWLFTGNNWSNVYDQNTWRLYSRIPQDQHYPKLEIYSARDNIQTSVFGVFPQGALNIRVGGLWGFVENTGNQATPVYAVPKLIQKACKILAVAWMDTVGDGSLVEVLRSYGKIEEHTRHHSYKLSEAMSAGDLTGIPAVDQVLRRYRRMGGAGHV